MVGCDAVAVVEAEEVTLALQTPVFSTIPESDVFLEPRQIMLEMATACDTQLDTELLSTTDYKLSVGIEHETETENSPPSSSATHSVNHRTSVAANPLQRSVYYYYYYYTSRKPYRLVMRYCVNCGLSVGQCRDPFSSHWCRLSSSRGWTTAMRHWPAFHHISCHGCSQ